MLEEKRKPRTCIPREKGRKGRGGAGQSKLAPSTVTKALGTDLTSRQDQELWEDDREKADGGGLFPAPCLRSAPSMRGIRRCHPPRHRKALEEPTLPYPSLHPAREQASLPKSNAR